MTSKKRSLVGIGVVFLFLSLVPAFSHQVFAQGLAPTATPPPFALAPTATPPPAAIAVTPTITKTPTVPPSAPGGGGGAAAAPAGAVTAFSVPANIPLDANGEPLKCKTQAPLTDGTDCRRVEDPRCRSSCPVIPGREDAVDENGNPILDANGIPQKTYRCATDFASWQADKTLNYWVDDPEVTALGKGGERSRQFLLWVLSHPSDDDSSVIMQVWALSRNIAYFFILIIAVLMGIGIIIGSQSIGLRNFRDYSLNVSPLFIKLVVLILYATFSAAIVLLFIQITDIFIEFFIRTLGVRELFNIFFNPEQSDIKVPGGAAKPTVLQDSEMAYRYFTGCMNLNINVQESARTSKFLVKFTNMTYYFIGIMFLLRKIVLWFLLIVSPFLALLAPFVLIRNTGWIWIGVFFQWAFYGPLMALFLGALARIWNSPRHIPFIFDFSRVAQMEADHGKMVYPTAINILYGGPAQKLAIFNSSSYTDTFAEYIIALLMLWAVIILPWWLLRIFRDYCCEGIAAVKNVLIANLDHLRATGVPGGPHPAPFSPAPVSSTSTALKLPKTVDIKTTTRLTTVQEIRQAKTEDLARTITMQATKISDIARMETNKESRETVARNINYLQNPMKAETPTEKQRFMTMRTELYDRAIKGDQVARSFVSTLISDTKNTVRASEKERILRTVPKSESVTKIISVKVGLPQDKVAQLNTSVFAGVAASNTAVERISAQTSIAKEQVKTVLQAMTKSELAKQNASTIINTIANETRVEKVKIEHILRDLRDIFTQKDSKTALIAHMANQFGVPKRDLAPVIAPLSPDQIQHPTAEVVSQVAEKVKTSPKNVSLAFDSSMRMYDEERRIVSDIAEKEHLSEDVVRSVVGVQVPALAEPAKHIEDSIIVPPGLSLEDYEEVKQMWSEQYERGEVPVSESIADRKDWINTDILTVTNILNKLMSSNEELRSQALDEVGYILPVFMVNNMKGEDLTVYLKAKLEAAKQVKRQIVREEAIKQGIKVEEEEYVDIDISAPKEEKKTMYMHEEIKEPQTTSEQAATMRVRESVVEDRVSKDDFEGLSHMVQSSVSHVRPVHTKVDVTKMNVRTITDVAKLDTSSQSVAYVNNLHARGETFTTQKKEILAAAPVSILNTSTIVAKKSNANNQNVTTVLGSFGQVISSYKPLTQYVARSGNIGEDKVLILVQNLSDRRFLQANPGERLADIQQSVGLTKKELSETLNTFAVLLQMNNREKALYTTVAKSLSLPVQAVRGAFAESQYETITAKHDTLMVQAAGRLHTTPEALKKSIDEYVTVSTQFDEVIAHIATELHMPTDVVRAVLLMYVQLYAAPEEHLHEAVSIPDTVSIEDYEEVKKMWISQYENGEVPISDTIKTRAEWIHADIVSMTNIFEKLLSADQAMRLQGLDEVGYLLPVFLTSNMTMDEVVVYLKAKIEAAKQVKDHLEQSGNIQAHQEEFEEVEISANKQQSEHTGHMQEEVLQTMSEQAAATRVKETIKQQQMSREDEERIKKFGVEAASAKTEKEENPSLSSVVDRIKDKM